MEIPTTPQHNDLGLDGFAFVEFAGKDSELFKNLFKQLGFAPYKQHAELRITAYKQGNTVFLLNEEPTSFAYDFTKAHGPCACGMGFYTRDANFAANEAIKRGAKRFTHPQGHPFPPTINGIGNSALYLLDHQQNNWLDQFIEIEPPPFANDKSLLEIDHLTHNVYQGNMDQWAEFYCKIFNFHQIRFFDIEGQKSGLISRALCSPCGKIKIPLNESKDDHSQIEEYLHEYHGEGIQHIALSTDNIYHSVRKLRDEGMAFLSVPDTYYDIINERIPDHNEPIEQCKELQLLLDGSPQNNEGLLLQIFTQNVVGPIFFEIIQRKGNEGFGEGNFTALFEAIERDQMRRGVL